MKILKSSILIVLCFCFTAQAQQIPQHTFWRLNLFTINPSMVGIDDYSDIKVSYRNQWRWAGTYTDAPQTFYATASVPFGNKDNSQYSFGLPMKSRVGAQNSRGKKKVGKRKLRGHSGLGGQVMYDQIGPFTATYGSAAYAYHYPLNDKLKIGVGGQLGFVNYGIGDLTFEDQVNEPLAETQPVFAPTLGLGGSIYSDNFMIGVSSQQVFPSSLTFTPNPDPEAERGQLDNHVYVFGSLRFRPSPLWSFMPSLLVKTAGISPASIELNFMSIYLDRFFFGAAYRSEDAASLFLGYNINARFMLAYAYDQTANQNVTNFLGAHEILLNIRFPRDLVSCPTDFR